MIHEIMYKDLANPHFKPLSHPSVLERSTYS